MMVKKIFISAFLILTVPSVVIYSLDKDTNKIMPFVYSGSQIYCSSCHQGAFVRNFREEQKACDPLCYTCHRKKDMEAHHPVGEIINDKLPKEIRLTRNNEIACFSCHNLKVNRYASKTYRAESLFEKMFSIKKQYKSYYLVERNNSGQLCKRCH